MDNKDYINPRDIPRQYLEKYHRSGPRYTSYPTAPQFKTEFDPDRIAAGWRVTNSNDNGLSIYTHFPFCRSRCLYCGCFTHIGKSEETKAAYLDALKREVDAVFSIIDPARKVHQMAFGGGTPTFMKADQLTAYVKYLERRVTFDTDAERSIEIDPRGVDELYLDILVKLGFNRFSFGVQDMDPDVQKIINRVLDERELENRIAHLRRLGVEAINLDLIYGLPGQTPDSFAVTIDKVTELRPSRIALFGYAHVPWVSPHQEAMEKHKMPDPSERMELFGRAFDLLMDAGYRHIGMDHFALPGDELLEALTNRTLTRNFMGYTTRRGLDLIGIGASSISSVGMTYAQNEKIIDTYMGTTNGSRWIKALELTPEDNLRREIIMDLFCNFYLDTAAVAKKFDIDFAGHFGTELAALESFREDGLIEITDNALAVTETGKFFIRNICMNFDGYLKKEDPEKRYSKTI